MSFSTSEPDRPRITSKFLRNHCKLQHLYQTPELNDKLYLHYKGFTKIENLEEYTGLKVLWLEANGISKIEGLDHQVLLRCLYLHQNLIETIENLDTLVELDQLNLSDNQIGRIDNLAPLAKLHTLQLAHNRLETYEDLVGVAEAPSISVLDLSNNKLGDPRILEILERLPNLGVLNLMGNPVISKIENYRRTVVSRLPRLTYLDDRPVFPDERRCTIAWARGGHQAEVEERELIHREEKERNRQNFEVLDAMQRAYRTQDGGDQAESEGSGPDQDDYNDSDLDDLPPIEDDDGTDGFTGGQPQPHEQIARIALERSKEASPRPPAPSVASSSADDGLIDIVINKRQKNLNWQPKKDGAAARNPPDAHVDADVAQSEEFVDKAQRIFVKPYADDSSAEDTPLADSDGPKESEVLD
eukprot:TRINITY_DN10302_c0_g1_i1.p1 TRINITY_DN10302_c0_g1~~TRINITY_DN10302_c0_g1_i1.p1  ORF type:complete len:441 (+),score=114.47 TRINITY_DN10302_c0_g1_i1:81-1325(+)